VATMKHVLFIVENQSVPHDVRVWSEALAVKEFGYAVSVICPSNERGRSRYESVEGISIYRHPMPLEANTKIDYIFEYLNALFWELVLSLRIYVLNPFHIIHAANPPDHVFIIALFFKLFGIKYIFDHHDIMPETYSAKFGKNGFMRRCLILMERLTFKTANVVISTNESYRNIAIQRGEKLPEDVFVVRNGPDLSKVIFKSANQSLKDGFDYLVAYLGVMNKQEGIENLLESVKYIVNGKKIRNTKFVLIGTGPEWGSLVSLSRDMGLERYIEFTGFIPYEQLYEFLATADVCVNPEPRNAFTDKSTMIKIMDYMVFGKPIVMYHTHEGEVTAGESALYIKNNDTVEFSDTLVALLSDSCRREAMGRIARDRVENELNWAKQKKALREAYRRLEINGI
jgi:glycosyltransferase involved in cell wall biosynthesis